MSKSIFESKGFKKAMSMIYGFGASIVITGALFKILHWPGADAMLIVGLLTEAGIFAISAFEPLHKEYDWSLVYPELAGIDPLDKKKNLGTVSQQLDKMLEEAKVGPELFSSLGTGLKSLSTNVSEMASLSNSTIATNEYTENLQKATKSIGEIGDVSENFSKSLNTLSGGISTLADNIVSTGDEAGQFKSNITNLNKNISNLNNVYGNMLSAMTGAQASR
jgi:gliding motility-associated protein GldL